MALSDKIMVQNKCGIHVKLGNTYTMTGVSEPMFISVWGLTQVWNLWKQKLQDLFVLGDTWIDGGGWWSQSVTLKRGACVPACNEE